MQLDFYTNITRLGNAIGIRGIRNGKDFWFKENYEPVVYLENEAENFGYTNLYGKNLKPIKFDSLRELKQFTDSHKGSNLKIYGFPHYHSQYALENYIDSVDKFDKSKIRVFNIDIEVTSNAGFPDPKEANYPITALCLYDSVADKFVTFGIGKWDKEDSILPDDVADKVVYINCESEMMLINKFTNYWTNFYPNIVTGWNTEMFDLPYIYNRMERLGFDVRKLSPWNRVNVREINTMRGVEQTIDIAGIDLIDYIALYKKNKVQESYRLDYIAQVELGERKSLGTVEMLDMSRVPFVDSPSNNLYDTDTDDEEFNRFSRIRKERVETENDLLLEAERRAAFQAFISYNIQDVNLVKRLDDKLGLLDANIMIGYEACMNFSEVASPVRTWDCLINKEMWKNNQIPHFMIETKGESGGIPGGYVKSPHVGKHGWCASFDLNSLYPHLIMQFNISPETIDSGYRLWELDDEETRVRKLLAETPFEKDPKYSVSASGYRFDNSVEGIIPRLMRKMYADRKTFKKKMLADDNELQKIKGSGTQEEKDLERSVSLNNLRQYVMKILLNSGYGALINKYFRWFDKRMGESITLSGQMLIQVAERELNKWMNKVVGTTNVDYVIAIDTDSNYLNLQPLVDKYFPNKTTDELVDILDDMCGDKIQKVLDKGFEEAREYLNAYDQKMVMEREAIASSAFWTAKKRYAMCVWDMEGVRMAKGKPKIKIQGLEAIRSSTPYVCREPLLDVIKKTLLEDEEDVQRFIAEFKAKFNAMSVDEIGMPRSMNNLNKYTINGAPSKGCPAHTRGAIMFNLLLDRHNLSNYWEKIQDGEKGKFVYLRTPNSVGSDTLSFITKIPEEFDADKYVDYNKMFEKIIIDPAKNILEPIGWSVEKKLTLESFFG